MASHDTKDLKNFNWRDITNSQMLESCKVECNSTRGLEKSCPLQFHLHNIQFQV